MTNAEKFKEVFGVYATETWAMPESDFLLWLNGECNGEERKTGKWIITARNGVLCSECKSGTRRMPMLFGNPLYKYCPFCGAKMEGVEE